MASKVWQTKACFNIYVRDALVTGFAERKDGKKRYYDFAVEVVWSDGRKTYVKRTYKDFLLLREGLARYGRGAGARGKLWSDDGIPKLEGLKLFSPSCIEQAEQQEFELNRFLQTLAKTRGELMYSRDVVEFFEARPRDPHPYHRRSDIDELSEVDSVAVDDEVVFDAGKWRSSHPENVSLLKMAKPW